MFGDDADEFRPERWLISDHDKLAEMNRHWIPVSLNLTRITLQDVADMPSPFQFGVGSRTCIGRHISTLEISKLIPRIVRDFSFELLEGSTEASWTTKNAWFVKPQGFKVKVACREPRIERH